VVLAGLLFSNAQAANGADQNFAMLLRTDVAQLWKGSSLDTQSHDYCFCEGEE